MRMADVRQKIGSRMRVHADALGWGPSEIAERLGRLAPESRVEPNSVGRWWKGTRLPKDETMDLYADCLGVDVGVFFAEALPEPLDEASIGFAMMDWEMLSPEERTGVRRQVRVWSEKRRQDAAAVLTTRKAEE